jgi:hypothetical protein
MRKTAQIQLRVTPAEKSDLVRRARAEGLDLSAWMLGRLAPSERTQFRGLVRALARADERAPIFAEIHDLLQSLGRASLRSVLEGIELSDLGELEKNQLAAMVETAAARHAVSPPLWVRDVAPLRVPWFATTLVALRLHLLTNSPPAFRRRNLFVDATLGSRV